MKLLNILSVFLALKCAFSARILGVFPMEWGSHYILGLTLMKGLAEAGHDVTMITPRKSENLPKNGSWTDVVLDGFGDKFKNVLGTVNFFDDSKKNTHEKMKQYAEFLLFMSNHTLRHPNVQQLMNSHANFDVVIIEQLMNECHLVLAYHFNCPSIILSSIGPNPMVNPKVGNPSPVSTVPNFQLHIDHMKEMSFVERFKNLFANIVVYAFTKFYIFPQHNKILHEVFPGAPDINDLNYNVSLVLLNSHISLTKAVPMVPNMVEIGGYHINPPNKLPKDLQEYLDGAEDGAIYFSMGSNLKSKDMPAEKTKALLNVFGKLKQKVLWKFEEDLPGKPNNVLIKNWMPQQDILAHPKIKLFITHGGLLSATETIYHGVPVLTIPVFGDQETNAHKAVQMGIGLKISYNDDHFNEKTLYQLIQELLNNPQYQENAKSRSKIFHDRPMTPMQSAVYWIEYVIRHKGAPHLRVAGVRLPWYKYFMVDVTVVLIATLLLFIVGIKFILKKLIRLLQSKTTKPNKLKKI